MGPEYDAIPVYKDLEHFPFGNFPALLNAKHMEEIGLKSRVCKHLRVRAGSENRGLISLLGSERPAALEQAHDPREAVVRQDRSACRWDVRAVDARDGLAAGLGSVGDRVPGPPAYPDGG